MSKSPAASDEVGECNDDNDIEEEYLSNHTNSMRTALKHCQELLNSGEASSAPMLFPPHLHETAFDAWKASQTIPLQREEALKEIINDSSIPIIEYSDQMSVLDCRKRFLHANRPCLIRGMDRSSHFEKVSSEWQTEESNVNIGWFQIYVGDDTIVPVRQQTATCDLDGDGRAAECTTVNMTLREWCHTIIDSPHLYLKDWHFQKWWEQRHRDESPLYTVPPLFRRDLLNNFLLHFTDGDYRFVYWGPTGSETPLHSDVLHSFSWSYNVVGEKKWTFHVGNQEIVLYQHAGELVFVPSTWTHKVENLCETLSINHNWITTADIDNTWKCLSTEIEEVDMELGKWNNVSSWDAKEFMLRGCVGLDVTAFFFMVFTELIERMTQHVAETGEEENWERFFDIFRLHQVLEMLLKPETHLQERMTSVLEQDALAFDAMNAARYVARDVNAIKARILNL